MGEKSKKDEDTCRIKVHIRLKLSPDTEKSAAYNIFADGTQLQMPNSEGRLELDRWYRFDHIYSAISSNKEVYRLSGYDLVETSLKGINTAIFAYGQTGSGKTRTLMSKDGVMAHMVSHLFHRIWKSTHQDVKVAFSYFQIHNERIYDLLNSENNAECVIREDAGRGIYVENVARVLCETPMDVYELINVGRRALLVGETKMNRLSCRSHTICQLSIEKKKKSPRKNRRSMQEACTAIPDIEDGSKTEVDFTTVPFNKRNFRQRHSTSVSKSPRTCKTQPNSPGYNTTKTSTPGHVRSRTSSPGMQRSKTSSPGKLRPRANSMKGTRSNSRASSPSIDLGKSSCLPLPRKGWDKQRSTSYPEVGLENVEVLSEIYQTSIEDGDNNQRDSFIEFNPDEFDESESEKYNDSEYADLENGYDDSDDKLDVDDEFDDDNEQIVYSKISIVDLAGSERLTDADRSDAKRLRENQNINLSLLELGNVISALAGGGKKKHVPYRNSVLTRLLQDTLGGNCKTKFILFISTKLVDVNETKCTLEFGQKLLEVSNKPVLNLDIDYKKKYEDLLAQLNVKKKGEKAMREERVQHLEAFEREKEEAKATLREQELLIVLLQTKLNSADMEHKKYNSKIINLQKILEDKDELLATQDVEILKQKVELDILLAKLAAKNFLTEQCVKETEKSDAATNTSLPDLTVIDDIDGSMDSPSVDQSDEEVETMGAFYLPGYEKCIDVINISDDFSKPSTNHKSIDDFSENGYFVETKDATTNTGTETRDMSTSTETEEPTVRNPIVVTFLQTPPKPDDVPIAPVEIRQTSDVATNTPTTELDRAHIPISSSDRRDSGYRDSTSDPRSSPDVECSTQTDLAAKYGNVDRVRSAILVELLSLQKLCQRSKIICDDPLFQSDLLTGQNDYTPSPNEDTDSVCDGLSSVIAEIFNILPNMFSENNSMNEWRKSKELSHTITDKGYINNAAPLDFKHARPKEQLVFLKDYLRNRKKSVDKELLNIAYDITNNHTRTNQDSDTVLEQKIIEGLIEKLSGRSLLPASSLDELKKLLNVILCDHTITACLLALTQKQNLYYYNYSETDFELMSNSTVESGEYNNNSTNYSYQLATRSWSERNLRSPHSFGTFDMSERGNDTKKDKTGLNRFLCMPFKSRKSSRAGKGSKDK